MKHQPILSSVKTRAILARLDPASLTIGRDTSWVGNGCFTFRPLTDAAIRALEGIYRERCKLVDAKVGYTFASTGEDQEAAALWLEASEQVATVDDILEAHFGFAPNAYRDWGLDRANAAWTAHCLALAGSVAA